MKDAPVLFLRLSERKGSRMADNKGLLGNIQFILFYFI
jgi:hypothetical protein